MEVYPSALKVEGIEADPTPAALIRPARRLLAISGGAFRLAELFVAVSACQEWVDEVGSTAQRLVEVPDRSIEPPKRREGDAARVERLAILRRAIDEMLCVFEGGVGHSCFDAR